MTNLNPTPRFGLVLDCADLDCLAEFWSAALGYRDRVDVHRRRRDGALSSIVVVTNSLSRHFEALG